MASNDIIKEVSHHIDYYFRYKRLEDGFDLSGPLVPVLKHPPQKQMTLINVPSSHDRSLKHFFSHPMLRVHLAKLKAQEKSDCDQERMRNVKKLIKRRCYSSGTILRKVPDTEYHLVTKQSLKRSKSPPEKPITGAYPVINSNPPSHVSKKEADRIVNMATRILLKNESVNLRDTNYNTTASGTKLQSLPYSYKRASSPQKKSVKRSKKSDGIKSTGNKSESHHKSKERPATAVNKKSPYEKRKNSKICQPNRHNSGAHYPSDLLTQTESNNKERSTSDPTGEKSQEKFLPYLLKETNKDTNKNEHDEIKKYDDSDRNISPGLQKSSMKTKSSSSTSSRSSNSQSTKRSSRSSKRNISPPKYAKSDKTVSDAAESESSGTVLSTGKIELKANQDEDRRLSYSESNKTESDAAESESSFVKHEIEPTSAASSKENSKAVVSADGEIEEDENKIRSRSTSTLSSKSSETETDAADSETSFARVNTIELEKRKSSASSSEHSQKDAANIMQLRRLSSASESSTLTEKSEKSGPTESHALKELDDNNAIDYSPNDDVKDSSSASKPDQDAAESQIANTPSEEEKKDEHSTAQLQQVSSGEKEASDESEENSSDESSSTYDSDSDSDSEVSSVQSDHQNYDNNDPVAFVEYIVTVTTGNLENADTNAPIKLYLFGNIGCSDELELSRSSTSEVPFKKGQRDKFTVKCRKLGEVERIEIGHRSHLELNDWYVDTISVEDTAQKKIYYFTCRQWFSIRSPDAKTMRVLHVSAHAPP